MNNERIDEGEPGDVSLADEEGVKQILVSTVSGSS
jgi:hypothetical protein